MSEKVYLTDLAEWMKAHPTARIVGKPNADTWPSLTLAPPALPVSGGRSSCAGTGTAGGRGERDRSE